MKEIITALAVFAVVILVSVYFYARYVAKKYCEYYRLDFKRFWRDIFLLKNKWEDSEWSRRKYKLNKE